MTSQDNNLENNFLVELQKRVAKALKQIQRWEKGRKIKTYHTI